MFVVRACYGATEIVPLEVLMQYSDDQKDLYGQQMRTLLEQRVYEHTIDIESHNDFIRYFTVEWGKLYEGQGWDFFSRFVVRTDDPNPRDYQAWWDKVLNPRLAYGVFTVKDDNIIRAHVAKYGPNKWDVALLALQEADPLCNRTAKSLRERWFNALSPKIELSYQQWVILQELVETNGFQWKLYSQIFEGIYSDRQLKQYYNDNIGKPVRRRRNPDSLREKSVSRCDGANPDDVDTCGNPAGGRGHAVDCSWSAADCKFAIGCSRDAIDLRGGAIDLSGGAIDLSGDVIGCSEGAVSGNEIFVDDVEIPVVSKRSADTHNDKTTPLVEFIGDDVDDSRALALSVPPAPKVPRKPVPVVPTQGNPVYCDFSHGRIEHSKNSCWFAAIFRILSCCEQLLYSACNVFPSLGSVRDALTVGTKIEPASVRQFACALGSQILEFGIDDDTNNMALAMLGEEEVDVVQFFCLLFVLMRDTSYGGAVIDASGFLINQHSNPNLSIAMLHGDNPYSINYVQLTERTNYIVVATLNHGFCGDVGHWTVSLLNASGQCEYYNDMANPQKKIIDNPFAHMYDVSAVFLRNMNGS
jgi:hypothetical protein